MGITRIEFGSGNPDERWVMNVRDAPSGVCGQFIRRMLDGLDQLNKTGIRPEDYPFEILGQATWSPVKKVSGEWGCHHVTVDILRAGLQLELLSLALTLLQAERDVFLALKEIRR